MSFLNKLFHSGQAKPLDERLLAPVGGTTVRTADIPDPVFSQEMMGPTLAILPEEETICAPVSGELTTLFPTGHAFGLQRSDGAEILVHIGIDTVRLNGKGFTLLVQAGETVKAGDPIIRISLDTIEKEGLSPLTMTILTNPDDFAMKADLPAHVQANDEIARVIKPDSNR